MQRYIDTCFWDDEFIVGLDPSEKLMYMYLMTNPLTTIAGVYKITLRRICFDTGFNETTVNYILQKFEAAKKVFKFGEYIIIRSWCKHQKWQTSKPIKTGIISVLKELPKEVLQKLVEVGYTFDLTEVFTELGMQISQNADETPTLKQDNDTVKDRIDTPCIPPIDPPSYIDDDADLNFECEFDDDANLRQSEQELITGEAVEQQKIAASSSSSSQILSEPQQNYAKLVFDKFNSAGLPCQNGDFIKFCMSDFRLALDKIHGINSRDVLQAIDNYICELKNPNSYVTKELGFDIFVSSKTFRNCLPANYRPKNFKSYTTGKQSATPTPMQNIKQNTGPILCRACGIGYLDNKTHSCSNPDCIVNTGLVPSSRG